MEIKSEQTREEAYLPKEVVLKNLHPREEQDQAGFLRTIYQFKNTTFSFRGREELPLNPTITKEGTKLVGSKPLYIKQEKFEAYKKSIETSERSQHLLATKDTLGILELAVELGTNDSKVKETLNEVQAGHYSAYALELIDQLIACNWIADRKDDWTQMRGDQAEAIIILSLLGHPEAQTYIQQQTARLKRLEERRIAAERNKFEQELTDKYAIYRDRSQKAADPKRLVAVHATAYQPVEVDAQTLGIQHRFDSSGGKILRNTLHVTLNQRVAGHLAGNWDSSRYTLLANFEKMITVNGLPASIGECDTWWVRNPGEPLLFPDAHLVEPGILSAGVFEILPNRTLYKESGYTPADIANFVQYCEKADNEYIKRVSFDIALAIREAFEKAMDKDPEACARLVEFYTGKSEEDNFQVVSPEDLLWTFTHSQVESLAETVGSLLEAAGFTPTDDPSRFEAIIQHVTQNLEASLAHVINSFAVEETIRRKGHMPSTEITSIDKARRWLYEVGGGVDMLAVQLGVGWTLHFDSKYNSLTYGNLALVNEAGKEGGFDWKVYNPSYNMGSFDPKTRRIIYASGASTSRS